MTKQDKWIICPICRGNGTHVNPNIDSNGLTADDFNEDPDFAEGYFAGDYDVTCQTCCGTGKIKASEWKAKRQDLADAAADRRLAALEDGQDPGGLGDYRYGA